MRYPVPVNDRFIARSKTFSRFAGAFVMLVGALILAGWLFDIYRLKSIYGGITMKANAALSLLLAGVSLLALNLDNDKALARRAGQVCAATVALVGALTLSQHIFGWDLGIDQLLFTEPAGSPATTSPGRMGPPASSYFTLYGITLLLVYSRRAVSFSQLLATIVCFWALLAIIGYTYQAEQLYGVARYTGIALPTAVSLFLLGLGLLAARLDQGITSVISSGQAGGLMARRLLIAVVGAPFLLGWLRLYAQRAGYYDLGFGTALLVLAIIIIFTLVVWQGAVKVNRAEEKVNVANERFKLAEVAANGFVYDWDFRSGRVERSEGLLNVIGYRHDEVDATPEWWRAQIHPEDIETANQVGRTALERGDEGWSNEYRVRNKQGHYVYVLDRSLIIRDVQGCVLRVVGSTVDITERKRSEEALRAKESELEEVINRTPFMLTRCSRDLRYRFVSRAYAEMIGRTPEEVAGKSITEIMGEEGLKTISPYIEKVLQGQRVEYETEVSFSGVVAPYLRVVYTPDRDGLGNVTGWFASIIDITEHRHAEENQRLLFEIAEIIRLAGNTDDLLFDVSRAVGEHLEVRRCLFNETDLENDRETIHRDYCRGVASVAGVNRVSDYSPIAIADMMAGKTVVNRDSKTDSRTAELYERTYAPNGERAYIAVPLMRENRWVATLWVSDDRPRNWSEQEIGLLEAVGERTWLAVEKLRGEEALREAEQRMRLALQVGAGASWDMDLTTGKTFWSETHFTLLGYEPDPAGEAHFEMWRKVVHEDDLAAALAERRRAEESRDEYHSEHRIRRADTGEIRWLDAVGRFYYDDTDKAARFVGVFFDITERKRGEEERELLLAREQGMRAEAERANRLKDEFLATISHELRTPLNAILGWATMLKHGTIDVAMAARANETIERNARAQAQLIEDLLDVSRIISGKLRLEVKPTDLRSVINAAVDSVHLAADAKEIQLQMVFDPAACHIQGDASRLQQVVWNLLSNAVKFTPKGGLVQVRLDGADSKARITVSDTGEGISAEFLPYVFDRFQQADGSITRRHGGLGLGLAIARHIIELHGGAIEVHSAGVGQGASFTVSLPLAAARATVPLSNAYIEGVAREETLTTTDPAILYGLRILAVDDEQDTRDMLKGVLEHYGADVIIAASAREAFEVFPGWRPDVIVCDIGMPEEDGYSLIKRIRELNQEQGGNTLAIALTGYVRVEERMRALSAGYQMFVPKPVEAAELVSIIASFVGRTDKGMGGNNKGELKIRKGTAMQLAAAIT